MMRSLFLLFFFSISQFAVAQFKNILLDPGGSGSKLYEPSIAIGHKDPKIIVAASSESNVYYSANSGMSWNKKVLTSTLGVLGNPSVISDFKNNFYYFHQSNPVATGLSDSTRTKNLVKPEILDRIGVQESTDDGFTWSGGAFMGLNPPKKQIKERVAVDRRGTLFAAWTQLDNMIGTSDTTCRSSILLSSSTNGKKWSKPIVISQIPGDCKLDDNTVMGAMPAVTGDGVQVYVVWARQGKVFFDRSFDGGATFLRTDLGIVEQHGGWSMTVPGLQRSNGLPVLACDLTKKTDLTGALFMVWADQLNGENDTDIWFTRSFNFGDSWTPPIRINDDAIGKHQFLPSIAVDPSNGNLYIVYYDRRNYDNNQTDVYMAYSTNAGATFKNVKISEKPFVPTTDAPFGDYIGISASNGIITPIWTRMENGQTSIWTSVIKHEDLEKVK